jgi:hypothetical protein
MSDAPKLTPEFVHRKPQHTAVVRGEGVPVEQMIAFLDDAFTVLRAAVDAAAIAPDGFAFCRYDTELVGNVTVEAGIPLLAQLDSPLEFNGLTIVPGELPGGELTAAGRAPRKPYWESYHVTPGPGADPQALRTELVAVID